MRKHLSTHRLLGVGLLLLGVLLLGSCDLFEKESEESLTAPSVGTASDLPTFSGSLPSTDTEARSLFLDANDSLTSTVSTAVSNLAPSIPENVVLLSKDLNKAIIPKFAYSPEPVVLDGQIIPVGNGTVKIEKGTVKFSFEGPDTYEPNKTYYYKASAQMDLTINLENITVEGASDTYTFNGKQIFKSNTTSTITLTTDATGYNFTSMKLDTSLTIQMGIGASISTASGKGGKFLLSFPFEYSKSGVTIEEMTIETAELQQALQSAEVTIGVYDNNNKEASFSPIKCSVKDLNATEIAFMNMPF